MKKRLVSAVLLSSIATIACATQPPQPQHPLQTQWQLQEYQQSSYHYDAIPAQKPLHGTIFIVPTGTVFSAVTLSELNSSTLLLGQSVKLNLGQDFYFDNKLVAKAGSVVNGSVIHLKKASFAGKNGQLQVKFTNITTPHGQVIPITGLIKTTDATGILRGGTALDTSIDYAKDVSIGAASGAVGGVVMGAVSNGSIGKGAAFGTAIGAGLGLSKSIMDKGKNVIIPANSAIKIELTQPITANLMQTY